MGHFGIMVMAVDNLTIDNVRSDTRRDGFNIDSCKNVRISNCSVNSPWDDGLCLKSSFGLGYSRSCENITISSCYVSSAWRLGTMLDGTWQRFPKDSKDIGTGGGRIKFGTESNGGFINIAITNCIFDQCEGLAIESVDGAIVEDISVTNITMRHCLNPPIFMRLGQRLRGPQGTQIGRMKRILISNIVSYDSAGRFGGGGVIGGIPEHPIEDVKISDIYCEHNGVGTKEVAALMPPENLQRGPEAHMFGDIPASGFFVRHVKNIEFNHVEIAWSEPDVRPVFWLKDVDGAEFFRIKSPRKLEQPVFSLHNVQDFSVMGSRNVKDVQLDNVEQKDI
jgi:polygalacturonase